MSKKETRSDDRHQQVEEISKQREEDLKWKCKQCGVCCFFFILPVQTPIDIETEAYLEARGVVYDVSVTSEGFKGKLIIPAKCQYLRRVPGFPRKYECMIHNDKFANCRLAGEKECKEAKAAWKLLEEMKENGVCKAKSKTGP